MCFYCSQRPEGEVKDCIAARKSQKADREKLRRDRLNEQFIELGNVLGNHKFQKEEFFFLFVVENLLFYEELV